MIGRHVEQALRLSLRIGALEESERMLTAALDAIDTGVHALAADRRLLTSNRTGAAEFDDLFAIVGGRVATRRAEDAPRLDALLAAAAETGRGTAPRACVLTDPNGRRRVVRALPLAAPAGRRIGTTRPARTLLLTSQFESDTRVDPPVIRDVFDLSLGEARIASLVGAGATVRDAAGGLGIAEGAARAQARVPETRRQPAGRTGAADRRLGRGI